MKKIIILSIIALAAVGCGGNPEGVEAKQQQLAEKQKQLNALKEEIRTLKREIAELDTTGREEEFTKVAVKTVAPERFSHYVELTGTVTSKENVMISAEAGGRVVNIPVEEGRNVARGTVLVKLENDAASDQLTEAKSALELAKTTYEKRKNLWDQNIGSEIEYLQARNNFQTAESRYAQAQTQFNKTVITAPISGTVDNISVNEGEYVNIGAPVVRVVDLENVEIEADLSEEYLTTVQRGDTVIIRMPSLGLERKAVINFVGQVINPDNRSFTVKIKLNNRDRKIKPNVLANIMIRDYQTDSALVVPSIAINKDLKGDFVYVVTKGDGRQVAQKKYIKRGKAFGNQTEITEGISAGDQVIVSGFNQVNQGEPVELASAGMSQTEN